MGRRVLAALAALLVLLSAAAEVRASDPTEGSLSADGPSADAVPPYFDHYSSFSEMESFLLSMVINHTAVASLTSIGSTIEGRPIWGLRISNEPFTNNLSKPAVIIEANHHAREWMTSEAVMYIAYYMLENYQTDPYIWNIINTTQVWLIPKVNVDGFVFDGDGNYGSQKGWRKNRRDNGDGTMGVDLNRNYNWSWDMGDPNTNSGVYHGAAPFSEPETQALRDLALASNVSVYLAYHSYSQLILYPWGDTYDPAPDAVLLRTLGYEMQSLIPNVAGNGKPYSVIQSINLYPAYGVSEDWFYGATGAMSFTIELYPAGGGGGGFYPPPSKIPDVVQDNLWAAIFLMDSAASPRDVLIDMDVAPQALTVSAGVTATYNVTIHNNAHDDATFNLAASGVPLNWMKNMPFQVSVPAQSQTTFPVEVTAPWNDPGGSATMTFSAEMAGYEVAHESVTVSLTVNPILREAGVAVMAPPGQSAPPGSAVTYDFQVTNTGNVADTFSLNASSQSGWVVTAPPGVTIAAGGQGVVQVSVDVPPGALGGSADDVTLTATSTYDQGFSDSDASTTTVEVVRSVSLDGPATQWASPGQVVTLSFSVVNGGNVVETFDVEASESNGWSLSAPASVGAGAFGATTVDVQLGVPAASFMGQTDVVTVQVSSSADPAVLAAAAGTVSVLRSSEIALTPPAGSSGGPGDVVEHTFQVANLGNGLEVIMIDASVDLGWPVVGPDQVMAVAPSNSVPVTFRVTIPADAAVGTTALLTVSARSLYDSSATASAAVGTTVDQVYGMAVSAEEASIVMDPEVDGLQLTPAFTVDNMGNGPDTVVLSWDLPDGWTASAETSTLAMGAGGSAAVRLTVTVDETAPQGVYDVALTATSFGGPVESAVVSVTVLRPDLVLTGASVDRNRVSAGETVTVTASIRNAGAGRSPASSVVLYVDGASDPVAAATLAGLAPGEEGALTLELTLSDPGERTLTVGVDPADAIVEVDDSPEEDSLLVSVMAPSQGVSALVLLPILVLVIIPLVAFALWKRRRPR